MANGGWYGTEEEWERLERPLCELDPTIEAFAAKQGLTVDRNRKDWPSRSMSWGDSPQCLIQLYLADASRLTWNLWLCCSQDRDGARYWRQINLIEDGTADALAPMLHRLLLDAKQTLDEWADDPQALEFATKLTPLGHPSSA